MRLLMLVLILLTGMAGPVLAGPLEDGLTAYKTGDWDTAVRLLLPLAEKGDPQAQEKIGRLYDRGRGFPRNYVEAERWYRKAAEQGDAPAQSRLAFMYRSGKVGPRNGGPKEFAEALELYRKAATQGNPLAQVGLAYMLWAGEGTPVDPAAAALWFQKAADQGNALAQLSLGTLYEQGKGVPKDCVRAYKWFDLATIDDGEYEADLFARAKASRDRIAGDMTREQIAAAQKLVHDWKATRAH